MDWMLFVVEITKALAWPITIVVSILLFRPSLLNLIPALRHLKWKNLELKFSEQILELKAEAQEAIPQPVAPTETPTGVQDAASLLIQISPGSAIIQAWKELEKELLNSMRKRKFSQATDAALKGYSRTSQTLVEAEIINNEQAKILDRLRELRNEAAHATDMHISPELAQDYVDIAKQLTTHLRNRSRAMAPH